ncbi:MULTISPECIES: XkdX family protein [Bacillus subtilis group]|uniref:XkdX family protein n=1 Tax=Bacillus subtilis group TaxID=653685 RepID=UPI00018C7FED|nr:MULTISPECIES: XkdX family protein [Bacillus subtilis group]MBU5327619.1 XkdX family protein [Bacillus paralicheniformis]MDH3162320.1 XkdX family protein [Bacillus licheniformis]QDL76938.1 XkdX family protein [Bacillus licheniformis]
MFEGKSRYYGHFYYCWLNGSVTTKELYIHVENGMITEEERVEIMKNPRGDAFPDEV